MEQLPEVDAVVIPYGGGGLSIGIASAIKATKPDVAIFACETENSAPLTESFRLGEATVLKNAKPSIAEGIAGPAVFPEMWTLAQNCITDVIAVSEDDILQSIHDVLLNKKLLIEGASAATLAAVNKYPEKFSTYQNIICLISGGNLSKTFIRDAINL